MSSFTVHAVIPILILLATRLFPTRILLLCWPFAWISDLDTAINLYTFYFIGDTVFAHRALLHNVFILLPSAIAFVVLWQRMLARDASLRAGAWRVRWDAFAHVKWGYASVVITLYLFSHLLLDMFQGGIVALWPVLNHYVYPYFQILVDMQTGQPTTNTGVVTGPGAPTLSRRYPWLTSEELGIWIMLTFAWLAYFVYHRPWAPARPVAAAARSARAVGPSAVIPVGGVEAARGRTRKGREAPAGKRRRG